MKTLPKGQRQRPLERLLGLLLARADALSLLLLAAGLLGFAALPLLQRRISFDENALLAGSSRPTIRCVSVAGSRQPQSPNGGRRSHTRARLGRTAMLRALPFPPAV